VDRRAPANILATGKQAVGLINGNLSTVRKIPSKERYRFKAGRCSRTRAAVDPSFRASHRACSVGVIDRAAGKQGSSRRLFLRTI
jgi:hypothetical protein